MQMTCIRIHMHREVLHDVTVAATAATLQYMLRIPIFVCGLCGSHKTCQQVQPNRSKSPIDSVADSHHRNGQALWQIQHHRPKLEEQVLSKCATAEAAPVAIIRQPLCVTQQIASFVVKARVVPT